MTSKVVLIADKTASPGASLDSLSELWATQNRPVVFNYSRFGLLNDQEAFDLALGRAIVAPKGILSNAG
jgi:hypothetical protein